MLAGGRVLWLVPTALLMEREEEEEERERERVRAGCRCFGYTSEPINVGQALNSLFHTSAYCYKPQNGPRPVIAICMCVLFQVTMLIN